MERRSLIEVKKSQEFMAFFIIIIALLAFCLFFLVLNKVVSEISSPLTVGLNSSMPEASYEDYNLSRTIDQTSSATLLLDNMLPFILIGLFAFVMILGGSFMQHPILIIAGIIILGIVIMLAAIYSNVYNDISSTSEFSSTKADLPVTDKFMQYLPFIIFILAVAVTVTIVFARKGGGYVGY